jgi:hypothetical protein
MSHRSDEFYSGNRAAQATLQDILGDSTDRTLQDILGDFDRQTDRTLHDIIGDSTDRQDVTGHNQ